MFHVVNLANKPLSFIGAAAAAANDTKKDIQVNKPVIYVAFELPKTTTTSSVVVVS